MLKIEVERSIKDGEAYHCDCYDARLGDRTPERIVTITELLNANYASVTGLIPMDIGLDQDDERYIWVDLDEWVQIVGVQVLNETLADIINAKEGRTEYPKRTLPTTDLLPELKGAGFMTNIKRPQ